MTGVGSKARATPPIDRAVPTKLGKARSVKAGEPSNTLIERIDIWANEGGAGGDVRRRRTAATGKVGASQTQGG